MGDVSCINRRSMPDVRLCPKWLIPPQLTNTAFIHYAVSTAPGTCRLALPRDDLVAHHYRDAPFSNGTVDVSISHESRLLEDKLLARFGATVPSLMSAIANYVELSDHG